jgi:hypothetical protein
MDEDKKQKLLQKKVKDAVSKFIKHVESLDKAKQFALIVLDTEHQAKMNQLKEIEHLIQDSNLYYGMNFLLVRERTIVEGLLKEYK